MQSLIATALDGDEYVGMASLDLSSAFDVVDTGLLLKRLEVIGLPADIVLKERKFYVEANGQVSNFFDSKYGTVQGSILGPILYAIFVSPLFDLAEMTMFADDNYPMALHLISSSHNNMQDPCRAQLACHTSDEIDAT